MISGSLGNIQATVNDLQQKNAHHLMGKGELGYGEAQVARLLYLGRKPVGGADDQAQASAFQKNGI